MSEYRNWNMAMRYKPSEIMSEKKEECESKAQKPKERLSEIPDSFKETFDKLPDKLNVTLVDIVRLNGQLDKIQEAITPFLFPIDYKYSMFYLDHSLAKMAFDGNKLVAVWGILGAAACPYCPKFISKKLPYKDETSSCSTSKILGLYCRTSYRRWLSRDEGRKLFDANMYKFPKDTRLSFPENNHFMVNTRYFGYIVAAYANPSFQAYYGKVKVIAKHMKVYLRLSEKYANHQRIAELESAVASLLNDVNELKTAHELSKKRSIQDALDRFPGGSLPNAQVNKPDSLIAIITTDKLAIHHIYEIVHIDSISDQDIQNYLKAPDRNEYYVVQLYTTYNAKLIESYLRSTLRRFKRSNDLNTGVVVCKLSCLKSIIEPLISQIEEIHSEHVDIDNEAYLSMLNDAPESKPMSMSEIKKYINGN